MSAPLASGLALYSQVITVQLVDERLLPDRHGAASIGTSGLCEAAATQLVIQFTHRLPCCARQCVVPMMGARFAAEPRFPANMCDAANIEGKLTRHARESVGA